MSESGAHTHPLPEFEVDDVVSKLGGDYVFHGWVVAKFHKKNIDRPAGPRPLRYVVQNHDGLLHIFAPEQLSRPGDIFADVFRFDKK